MRTLIRFLLLLCLLPSPLWAASSVWQRTPEVSVRLISAQEGTKGLSEILMGLEIKLAKGWHIYWRSPGEAGLPPHFDWTESKNLESATLLYPIPLRYNAMGVNTIGYRGDVLLPLRVSLKNPGEPLHLEGELNLLICDSICVPKTFSLDFSLPASNALLGLESTLIQRAMEKVPGKESDVLSFSEIRRMPRTLQVTIQSSERLEGPDLFVEAGKDVTFARPTVGIGPDKQTALFTVSLLSDLPKGKDLTTLPLRLTVVDGEASIEKSYAPEEGIIIGQESNGLLPFWIIILLALLGGVILNLMPCVLPVLSLKIFAVLKHGGRSRRRVRHSFLSTASGILFSFLLLAIATIGFKATGQAVGWGVQFQHPLFLIFMIVVLVLFSANLWGFFEITLPPAITALANPRRFPKMAGDFATGALATLLATPCSAPFLGTAVAFALAAGPLEILSVFAMLGLGMSLPYLVIARWPHLASALPKPGKWMLTLTRLLGFGLALTAIWLLLVLQVQIGLTSTVFVAVLMLVILGQLYLRHRKTWIAATPLILSLAMLGALSLPFVIVAPSSTASRVIGPWQPFDEKAIEQYVKDGKTVFVDITADWCLTCKVNKRFALNQTEIKEKLFKDPAVIAMQADWTNPSPTITAFLTSHGRYGIPFDIVFGPLEPEGLTLPELLTPNAVLKAISKAQGKPQACPTEMNC